MVLKCVFGCTVQSVFSSRQARRILDYLALVWQGHCHGNYTLVFLKNKETERERESIVVLSTLVSLSLVEVSFDR